MQSSRARSARGTIRRAAFRLFALRAAALGPGHGGAPPIPVLLRATRDREQAWPAEGDGAQLHRRRMARAGVGRARRDGLARRPPLEALRRSGQRQAGRRGGARVRRSSVEVARVGRRGSRLPQACGEERVAHPGVLHRGVPARDPPADPQDAARGAEGLLRSEARL